MWTQKVVRISCTETMMWLRKVTGVLELQASWAQNPTTRVLPNAATAQNIWLQGQYSVKFLSLLSVPQAGGSPPQLNSPSPFYLRN